MKMNAELSVTGSSIKKTIFAEVSDTHVLLQSKPCRRKKIGNAFQSAVVEMI